MHLHTWADLQAPPPKRLWQRLRTMRSAPPGKAGRGNRRATFSAALEQAEQLFGAARAVGVATQPILTFYGVSQIGRAVAAMAPGLNNDEYQLSGHGLLDKDLQNASRNLAGVRIRGDHRGSFPAVARALNSCSVSEELTLGEIWGLIPDAGRFELPGVGRLRSLVATIDSNDLHVHTQESFQCRVESFPLPNSEHPSSYIGELMTGPSVQPEKIAEQRRILEEWFAPYPALRDADLGYSSPLQPVHVQYSNSGVLNVPVRIPNRSSVLAQNALDRIAPTYHGVNRVYPDVDGCGKPVDPLMAWWAVLYVLSRLARYLPNEWEELIRVGHSPAATAIEYLLDEAQVGVPDLAISAIERLGDM